jgi:hypothetical protein
VPGKRGPARYKPKRHTTAEGVVVYDEITNKTGGLVRLSRHPKTDEAMLGVGRDGVILNGVRMSPEEARHLRNALSAYVYHVENKGQSVEPLPVGRPWGSRPRPALGTALEPLVQARLNNGLTQGQVVQFAQGAFTVQQLSKWERGKVQPSPAAVTAWRKAMEGYLPQNEEGKP